jgi:hypothetical protein
MNMMSNKHKDNQWAVKMRWENSVPNVMASNERGEGGLPSLAVLRYSSLASNALSFMATIASFCTGSKCGIEKGVQAKAIFAKQASPHDGKARQDIKCFLQTCFCGSELITTLARGISAAFCKTDPIFVISKLIDIGRRNRV